MRRIIEKPSDVETGVGELFGLVTLVPAGGGR